MLDAAGTVLWARTFAGPDGEYGDAVAMNASGDVVVSGHFTSAIDFGGGPREGSVYVVKLDPAGEHLWSVATGSASQLNDSPTWGVLKLAVGAADEVVLATGTYEEAAFSSLRKRSAEGQEEWGMMAASGERAFAIAPSGAIVVGGGAHPGLPLNHYEPTGTLTWQWALWAAEDTFHDAPDEPAPPPRSNEEQSALRRSAGPKLDRGRPGSSKVRPARRAPVSDERAMIPARGLRTGARSWRHGPC